MLLRPRMLLVTFLAIGPGAFVPATAAAQVSGGQGYCASELSGPVVYFSPVFDTRLNPKVPIETATIAREFHEYLKGRFDYKGSSNFPVLCGVLPSLAAAEAAKADMKAGLRAASRQVDVEWTYQPDSAWVTASYNFVRNQDGYGSAPPKEPTDHGYCVSQPAGGAVYLSAVFDGKPQVNIALWQIAYGKHLGPKNGFIGTVSCGNGSPGDARRMLKARADGARAANRQVVETGWKYGAAATSAPAAKVDEDREPAAPPPPPPPPPASARDFATKEMPEVMTMCNSDRMISGALDCNMVARAVYNYRLAQWSAGTTPEPLAQLLAGDKLDCSTCVRQFAAMWASSRAQSSGYAMAPAQCVGRRFEEGIKAKPYVNRVKEVFDAALKACPK